MKVDYLINIKEKITSEFCTETLREHNIKIQCDQTLKSDYQKEPLPPSPVPEFYPSLPPSCLPPTMKSEKFLNPFQLETNIHCVESEILCIPPYSVRMRKNADQNNSEYGLFLRSDLFTQWSFYCNGTRTYNRLVRKRTLNHLAKLPLIWLSCAVNTYL